MIQFGLSTSVFGPLPVGQLPWGLAAEHGFSDIELVAHPSFLDRDKRNPLSAISDSAKAGNVRLTALCVRLDDLAAAIELVPGTSFGLLVVRVGPCRIYPTGEATVPDAHALRRILEPMLSDAERLGTGVALEFPATWSAQSVVTFLETIESPAMGVCLDIGHAHLREGVPETIEQLAGYVRTIHLHDNLGRTDEHRMPFAGSIDWPSAFMELEKTGYNGPMTLELPATADSELATVLDRAVGARTRLQAILDDLAQPMVFPE